MEVGVTCREEAGAAHPGPGQTILGGPQGLEIFFQDNLTGVDRRGCCIRHMAPFTGGKAFQLLWRWKERIFGSLWDEKRFSVKGDESCLYGVGRGV